MDVITVSAANKTLKGREVLRDINLTLARGQVHAFIGRNASGKTMLLRLIAGLILPTSGTVTVFGQPVSEQALFPESMGLMIEKIGLWSNLTGVENLETIAAIKRIAGLKEIRTALIRVGLDPDEKKKYRAYSLGMKQKLVLAQAIMESPDLLILDEPTNGLDESSVACFQTIIREEKARGATCLIATHQLDDIKGLYDHLYKLNDGSCEEMPS